MKRTIIFGLASAAICLLLLNAASAQVRGNYSRRDVNTVIRNLENSSDVFSREFRRQMNINRRNERNEDRFVRIVENFETAVDRLRRNFDRNNDWWESRNDVQSIMDEARQVNDMMNDLRFARQLEVQWRNMRRDINALARVYQLPTLEGAGGGNWDGGQGRNWGTVRPPSWAVGTFYGRSPQDGSQIILTIDRNGSITAQTGGSVTYGNYTSNNMIFVGGYTSRVTRTPGGIRTVSTLDGQTINYNRGGWAGDGGWNDRPGGNVPNWAVGSWVARNPQGGGNIYLRIDRNGSVTVNFDGGSSYGTLNGTLLDINGATSTVSQTRNGIRTTSTTDGQVIIYRRQ